ncbi:MAG TPA: GMC family oxidoreductase N-terminal domain-containing protein [Phenylobacterium sp.]
MARGARGRDAPGSLGAFHYVIVGGGAAGCVLANRLSAQPDVRVALVEAGGPDRHPLIHVPAGVAGLIGHPELDWRYSTAPQEAAADRRIALPRGRVLGGCTSTNGMVYFRGHPADYDAWAAAGCNGWGYSDVLPYFARSEGNSQFRDQPWHGADGPMRVSSYRRPNPLSRRFVEAGMSLGYPAVDDFNVGRPEGFGLRQATIRDGRRESTATAFLRPASNRPNLAVFTNALADRLVVEDGRVTGVRILQDNVAKVLTAECEVVLSAGAYGSPAILQRSGIGDATTLKGVGIEVAHHAPAVGGGLQDHLVAPVQMATDSALPYVVDWRVLPRLAGNLLEYALLRRGPLASNVFEATAFIRTSPDLPRPDVQLIFMPMHRAPTPLPRRRGFGILVALLRPRSRGSVRIASPDPAAAPIIDPRFLSDHADLPPLLKGLGVARRIFASGPFADLDATELLPGAESVDPNALADHVRRNCVTVHHPVGTCRMGPDADSVVDPTLRVRGLDGLRVVDASIMPTIIGGNTAAPVIMIAEKASDLILRAHRG